MSVQTKVSDSPVSTVYIEQERQSPIGWCENIRQCLIFHLKSEIDKVDFTVCFYNIMNKNEYLPTQLINLCINLSLYLDLTKKTKETDVSFINNSLAKLKDPDYKMTKSELLYTVVNCQSIYKRECSLEKLNLFI